MSNLGKRKCVIKIAILDKLRTGQTRSSIAKEYGVGCATVTSLKNNEEKLRSFASTMDSMEVSKKGRKVIQNMLDRCLLWYERQEESTATSLLLMKCVGDLAAAKRFTNF